MDSTVSAQFGFTLSTTEVPTAADAPGAGATNTVIHSKFNESFALNAGSTPPATAASYEKYSGGSGTIDLTALATLFGAQDCTGLKLRGLLITSPGNAGGSFTLAVGGTNGYAIGGSSIVCQAAGAVEVYFGNGLAAIDGTHKTLDWTNASGQPISVAL